MDSSSVKINKYGLYELQDVRKAENEIKQRYNRLIKPLASFAPFLKEEETFASFNNNSAFDIDDTDIYTNEEETDVLQLTINEIVKQEPANVSDLIDLIRQRIYVEANPYLTEADQEEMIRICIQEAKFKWKEMKRAIEDPNFDQNENIELRRRVFVNVISVCEKVYRHYIEKAKTLRSHEIFSDSANFSRLKTLMSCDLHKFLNIHLIKHHLASDMKKERKNEMETLFIEKNPQQTFQLNKITVKDLMEDFRLKYKASTRRYKTRKEHLRDMSDRMPILEVKKLEKLLKLDDIHNKGQLSTTGQSNQALLEENNENMRVNTETEYVDEITLIARLSDQVVLNKKRRSKSAINFDELSLSEELNLNLKEIVKDKYKTTDMVPVKFQYGLNKNFSEKDSEKIVNIKELSKGNSKLIASKLKKDLDNLTWLTNHKESLKDDKDDDALLMTLMSPPNQKERMKEIKKNMKLIEERKRKFQEEIQLPLVKTEEEQPQAAFIETNFFNNYPIRLSDIRVSTRVLKYNLSVETYGPLFNDINGEIDSDMVTHLDRNLYIGGEVKEVYDELVKTIDADYLRFDLDDYIQAAPLKLNYESSFMSTSLKNHGRTKLINHKLLNESKKVAPWGNMDFRQWNKTYINSLFYKDDKLKRPLLEPGSVGDQNEQYRNSKVKPPPQIKPFEIKPEKIELFKQTDPSTFKSKDFKLWLIWWQSCFSTEDYNKFLTTQQTDYLGLLFHLYDEKDSRQFIKTDEEIRLYEAKEEAERERETMINDMKNKKSQYEPGLWNPNSLLLGGLGKEPLPEESEDPVLKLKKSLEQSKPKLKKTEFFKRQSDENKEEEEAKNKILSMMNDKKVDNTQQRLEKVWTLLRMSDESKLDMAIKYCTANYTNKISDALQDWEMASNLIVEREKYIYELERFERTASDPNRFFVKGHRGSSVARLEEAQQRDNLYKQIDNLQVKIEAILKKIEKKYRDVITYNGRPYLDKMKWDRIEMLYYLNEQRRFKYFKNELSAKNLNTSVIDL